MSFKQHGRQYDLVLFGATGYTGQLTAEHITKHLPTNLKWAVAGRSESKLKGIIEECREINADRVQPGIELVNLSDAAQLSTLVKKAFVVITTIGPYSLYGEPVFKACAEAGTHYLDCTGEIPWVAQMIKKYEATAKRTGAIMFPQTGVESAPPDLATWALTQHVRKDMNAKAKEVYISIHKLDSQPSGGTLATVMAHFDQFSLGEIRAASKPYASSPIPRSSDSRPGGSILQMLFGLRSLPNLGLMTTSIAGMTDRAVVERTWGLLQSIPSRKSESYGPNFKWDEYFRARNFIHGVVVHWGLLIGATLMAMLPPLRSLIKRFIFQPGEGVSREQRAKESVEYRGTANPDIPSNPSNKQAFIRAWYNGGMYTLTATFLAQGALTLLEDDVQLPGGSFTAACLGQRYIDRLEVDDFKMEVKTIEG